MATNNDPDRVDIFEFLREVDSGNFEYFENLSEAQKKKFAPVVATRWMSCTRNTSQLQAVNALVNPFTFAFATKHKELLYKLMLIASSGTEKRYKWIGKKKSGGTMPNTTTILAEYYKISKSKASGYAKMFTVDEVIECAENLGYDEAYLKKIKNEFK